MFRLFRNPPGRLPAPLDERALAIGRRLADPRRTAEIAADLSARAGLSATPLLQLEALAERLGIGALYAKDERNRCGQGSFKVLGGSSAVLSLAREADVFAASTAGNHGRAVAFGAALAGAKAVIFIPRGVPPEQVAAIAALGATIVEIDGDYEQAAAACVERSAREGWTVVSDFAREGDEEIPARIMQGYTVLAAEALAEIRPTHAFVQAGVGGLAAAVVAYFTKNCTPAPVCVVVEAATTPCLLESARALRPVLVDQMGPTSMGRLECRQPSSLAWPVLSREARAFVAIDDDAAQHGVFTLAAEGLLTSPSGAAGLGGLLAVVDDSGARDALGLDTDSRVLVFLTEQATARDLAIIAD